MFPWTYEKVSIHNYWMLNAIIALQKTIHLELCGLNFPLWTFYLSFSCKWSGAQFELSVELLNKIFNHHKCIKNEADSSILVNSPS